MLGGTHPDTLTARNNLATAYQDAGRLEEAIPLLERTLTDAEQVLGGTHPDTLGSRNNLATAYQDAGRLEEAIPLWSAPSATPSGCWATPTPRRWAPATTWPPPTRTLGGWRRPSRCSSARSATAERVLGDTHPDTLTARNNLATAYQDAGRLEEAIPLWSAPSPTLSTSWAAPTPTPWAPATTSPPPTRMPDG